MARLNIAERRLPQDGRITISVSGVPVDLRVATTPTMHGESGVMRLLNRDGVRLDFGSLGIHGHGFHAYLKVNSTRSSTTVKPCGWKDREPECMAVGIPSFDNEGLSPWASTA